MRLIKTLVKGSLCNTVTSGGCGECKNSCQSACKTSCTVGNQVCQKTNNREQAIGGKQL